MKILEIIRSIITWPFKFVWVNIYAWSFFFRGLLPHPEVKKGDKFLVTQDMPSGIVTHYRGPYTGGFKCVVPQGLILVANHDSDRISCGFSCVPENEKEFEEKFVPAEQKSDEKYAGVSLAIPYKELGIRLKKK